MRAPRVKGGWDFAWDVVQVNVGLHDLKYVNDRGKLDLENGEQVASLAEYQANLRRIFAHFWCASPDHDTGAQPYSKVWQSGAAVHRA